MSEAAIFSVICIVDKFGSAIDATGLHELLPVAVQDKELRLQLSKLQASGKIRCDDTFYITDLAKSRHLQNKANSRRIFKENKFLLKIFAHLPWIRFIGLTGSNAFESCQKNDDIDLFVVCARDRLWISYFIMAMISKLLKKRSLFCLNYLVDESHLHLPDGNYYSAVQFYKMKPLFNARFKEEIFKANPWIKSNLPNAGHTFLTEPFYRLRADFRGRVVTGKIIKKLNRMFYRFYSRRWQKMYPQNFGQTIMLEPGMAKLHRNSNSRIYKKIEESIS